MAIAIKLKDYLDSFDVAYEVITHPHTVNSMQTAEQAHISGEKIAKAVLLEDDHGYMLAVLPATHRVQFGKLRRSYGRQMCLADEKEVEHIFDDCEAGAIPPVGKPYDMAVVVDVALNRKEDIYLEAGDHDSLIHLDRKGFHTVWQDAPHADISKHI